MNKEYSARYISSPAFRSTRPSANIINNSVKPSIRPQIAPISWVQTKSFNSELIYVDRRTSYSKARYVQESNKKPIQAF